MISDLQTMLGTDDGARQLDQWFGDVLRAGDFAGLDAFLAEEFARHPHPVANHCSAIGAGDMAIIGWDEFFADCLRETQRDRGKSPIHAVGINLTMHADPDGDDWGLEASLYDDSSYPFSARNLDAINRAASEGGAPWHGCFRDLSHALVLRGAGRLYAMLVNTSADQIHVPGQAASAGYAVLRLGWLFLTLRFHQALVRAVADVGMAAPMVVLAGSHDVEPHIEAAYWCEKEADHGAKSSQILADREATRKEDFRHETNALIEQWRDRRDVILRNQLREDKRQGWIDYCTASDALNRQAYALGDGPPVHLLSDHEFELLLYGVRCDRAIRIGDDPADIAAPPPRRAGLMGLFRRAA